MRTSCRANSNKICSATGIKKEELSVEPRQLQWLRMPNLDDNLTSTRYLPVLAICEPSSFQNSKLGQPSVVYHSWTSMTLPTHVHATI